MPQPAMQKDFSRMLLVVTRPLDSAQRFQPRITHAGIHGTERSQFVPDTFCLRLTPVMPQTTRQIKDDFSIVSHARRHGNRCTYALHATLAGCNSAFALTPAGCG